MSGGFSAQIVIHQHLTVIRYKDEVAVLHPANLFQALQDTADLLVEVDEISKVELAIVAYVWQPVRPIPVIRAVTNRVRDEIFVDPLQESRRRMKRGMGLYIADMRVKGLIGGRFINEI